VQQQIYVLWGLDLQFRLSMTEAQIIVDKRRYSFAAKTMEDRRLKQEAAARS